MDQQQSRPGASAEIAHTRAFPSDVQGGPVFFDGEFVLRVDAGVQCTVHEMFSWRQDNFLSSPAFYIRVSPLSLLVRESFGSPLFFASLIAAQGVAIEECENERPGV